MKPRPNTMLRFSAAVALACTVSVHAAPYTWGGGNSTWADTSATGWNGGPPVSGDTATINTGTVTAAGDNQLTGVALTIGSAGVLNDGGFYTYFSPTGSLTLNGGTINITRNNGYYYGWYDGSLSLTVNANSGSSFINTINASGGLRLEGDTTFSGDGNLTIGLGLHNWTDGYANFGNNSITKSGSGTLTLSGVNSYTGNTNVNGGKLLITGSTAAGSSVTVASGATLGGSGTVGGATTISGTHTPGNSAGVQSFSGNLSYASTSIFDWELASSASGIRGTQYDGVNVGGTLAGTAGAAFNVVLNSGSFTDTFWNTNQSWADIFKGGVDGSGSALNIASVFSTITGTGIVWDSINSRGDVDGQGYFTMSTSTLNWTAVPEPTSALAGLLIAAGLLRRRR